MAFDSSVPANALAGEKSPYLLQHAHNPVQWMPWGEAAFARARAEQKPIFLSVGYSTCHWCHVMAHESFENAEVAAILNAQFISIKVDREERPDVDRLYMSFVQATTGHGGWPMSVWLTPGLQPFVGGTYFPPEDRPGRVGFATLLQRIAKAWETNREGVVAQGEAMVKALRENATESMPSPEVIPLDAQPLERGYQVFAQMFDGDEGGWGGAPKFPRPTVFSFLFREYARRGAHTPEGRHAAEMALFTLGKMASGGMHDHLGGGFHRYSVDEFWHVPHFEKMLYDQAQLVWAYLEAAQLTGETAYADVARDILGYVQRDLTDPQGGFFSAEDADSLVAVGKPEHAEGAFYVWTQGEIESVLGAEDAALFGFTFGVKPEGNAPEGADPQGEFTGKSILIQRHSLAAVAEEFHLTVSEVQSRLDASKAKLATVRAQRPRPHLDDKIITAWNGLMIAAFARAYQVLGEPAHLAAAQRAATFVREQLTRGAEDQLLRSYRQGPGTVAAFADDYAFLIQGLLDLYEADFNASWLDWARVLQRKMDALFWDEKDGGYFSTSGEDASILLRLKEDYDGAEPSPNSVAALNLQRLAAMTGDEAWRDRSVKLLRAFHSTMATTPVAVPQLLAALDFSLGKTTQVVLAPAMGDDASLRVLQREVQGRFLPRKVVLHARDTASLREALPLEGKATAYVCVDFACQLPTNDPAVLRRQLTTSP